MTEAPSALNKLVRRLAEAEENLAVALDGTVDSIIDARGHTYLLRAAQQALLASEATAKEQTALLQTIFDHAPAFIKYVGVDGQIRYVNRTPPGLDVDSLVGMDWLSFKPEHFRTELKKVFDSVVATGTPVTLEGPGPSISGEYPTYARSMARVQQDGETKGVVVIARDITQQKAAEAQLVVSERLSSVGMLAAGVAHEINNPLAALIANLDFTVQELQRLPEAPGREAVRDVLNDARSAADRIRLIVRDLKVFSRAGDDELGRVDVERVMESTLRMAWTEIRHRARLVKDYGRVPPVRANESRLGQVFLNLVVNAAQAIVEGAVERNVIRIATSVDQQGRVVVRIADTGPGIPAEARKRLFTPFFTTKPVGAGTGLGLSICHRIVTALGGEISFDSELGKGTEFRVVLPAAPAEEAFTTAPRAALPASTRRGRIMVIDDEAIVGKSLRLLLGREHEVTVMTDAKKALALLAAGETYDVILCDLMMPQMSGMDLYAEVETSAPDQAARFVFMTGGAFTVRARQFLDAIPNLRLEKPFDPIQLRGIVNSLIR